MESLLIMLGWSAHMGRCSSVEFTVFLRKGQRTVRETGNHLIHFCFLFQTGQLRLVGHWVGRKGRLVHTVEQLAVGACRAAQWSNSTYSKVTAAQPYFCRSFVGLYSCDKPVRPAITSKKFGRL